MSGTYDLTLNPGATQPIMASGSYCKVISAPSGQLQLKLDSGELWTVYEGQGFRLPDGIEFSRVLVKNLGALVQTVLIVIGDSRFEDTRITGVVSIVDTDKYTTESAAAFMGANSSGAPGAGQFGTVQLFNPVANTKKAIIERVYIDVATATQACLGLMNATLGVASIFLASKLANGAVSTSRTYTFGANVADPALTLAANQWSPNVAAGVQLAFTPKRPFVLLPGYGLMVGARSPNIAITVTFEFWEQNL